LSTGAVDFSGEVVLEEGRLAVAWGEGTETGGGGVGAGGRGPTEEEGGGGGGGVSWRGSKLGSLGLPRRTSEARMGF